MNKGFTLIEVLVVVLIIGILAAIALPQYQKAVERSRMAQTLQFLGNWANAQNIYYMQNDAFAQDMEELNNGDVSLLLPDNGFFSYDMWADPHDYTAILATRTAGPYEGCIISIGVDTAGVTHRECEEASQGSGCCVAAASAGFEDINAPNSGDDFTIPIIWEDQK